VFLERIGQDERGCRIVSPRTSIDTSHDVVQPFCHLVARFVSILGRGHMGLTKDAICNKPDHTLNRWKEHKGYVDKAVVTGTLAGAACQQSSDALDGRRMGVPRGGPVAGQTRRIDELGQDCVDRQRHERRGDQALLS
jgi:hypothetical protein